MLIMAKRRKRRKTASHKGGSVARRYNRRRSQSKKNKKKRVKTSRKHQRGGFIFGPRDTLSLHRRQQRFKNLAKINFDPLMKKLAKTYKRHVSKM